MKIKKTFQGQLPENKILNTESSSQTDTYSCDYINEKVKEVYSTDEQVIGTYFGKPLYRKVIEYTNSGVIGKDGATTDINIPHNIANFERCYKKNASTNKGETLPIFVGGTGSFSSIYISGVDTTNIIFRIINLTWVTRTWDITIEYTKTTD